MRDSKQISLNNNLWSAALQVLIHSKSFVQCVLEVTRKKGLEIYIQRSTNEVEIWTGKLKWKTQNSFNGGWDFTCAELQVPLGWFLKRMKHAIYSQDWCKQGENSCAWNLDSSCMGLYRRVQSPKMDENASWSQMQMVWTCNWSCISLCMKLWCELHNWT